MCVASKLDREVTSICDKVLIVSNWTTLSWPDTLFSLILYVVLTHTSGFNWPFCSARYCDFYAHTVWINWQNLQCPLTISITFIYRWPCPQWCLQKERKAALLCANLLWMESNKKKWKKADIWNMQTKRSVLLRSSVYSTADCSETQNTTALILKQAKYSM